MLKYILYFLVFYDFEIDKEIICSLITFIDRLLIYILFNKSITLKVF